MKAGERGDCRRWDETGSSVTCASSKLDPSQFLRPRMAMPLDIVVTYDNGDTELFYAPLESMRGEKPAENKMMGTSKRTASTAATSDKNRRTNSTKA